MEWITALGGFALGLLSSYLILRIQRSWKAKDDNAYNKKVIESLISEIEEGIDRAQTMGDLNSQGKVSFSRIYTMLWESTNQRLAGTLGNAEILTLLHRIYYRFDLINFNCEIDRPGSGGAFAKQYLTEMQENLSNLKVLLRNS